MTKGEPEPAKSDRFIVPINALPGVSVEYVLSTIEALTVTVGNLNGQGAGISAVEYLNNYVRWANEAVRQLNRVISTRDLDRLVQTRRYWVLQQINPVSNIDLRNLVQTEVDERAAAFGGARDALLSFRHDWIDAGHLLVADTNTYLYADSIFTETAWRRLAGLDDNQVFTLVVPVLVVDELDALKRNDVRTNARLTLRALNALFSHSDWEPILNDDHSQNVRLLLDPPSHTRLPDSDTEVVDRSLALATITGMSLTVITRDVGMRFRAEVAGLDTVLLDRPDKIPIWDSRR